MQNSIPENQFKLTKKEKREGGVGGLKAGKAVATEPKNIVREGRTNGY